MKDFVIKIRAVAEQLNLIKKAAAVAARSRHDRGRARDGTPAAVAGSPGRSVASGRRDRGRP